MSGKRKQAIFTWLWSGKNLNPSTGGWTTFQQAEYQPVHRSKLSFWSHIKPSNAGCLAAKEAETCRETLQRRSRNIPRERPRCVSVVWISAALIKYQRSRDNLLPLPPYLLLLWLLLLTHTHTQLDKQWHTPYITHQRSINTRAISNIYTHISLIGNVE